ncbi:hypothetical protein BGZ76_011305 [Entomortierella beljakovae]|nr:hypothetical protein BGZ76_011305 [Entomortierella beljakovae]
MIIGLSVGIPLFVIIIAVIYINKRRKRKRNNAAVNSDELPSSLANLEADEYSLSKLPLKQNELESEPVPIPYDDGKIEYTQ